MRGSNESKNKRRGVLFNNQRVGVGVQLKEREGERERK
jgi:hypothetical protein